MFDFIFNPYFIQGIGFVGMGVAIFSFQCKNYQKLVLCSIIKELIFALQYLLLGSYTGMATNLTSCFTNSVYRELNKKGKSTLIFQIIFSCLFIAIGILTWVGPLSLLVIAAKVLSTVANGINKAKIIRFANLLIMPMWLVHDIAVFSIAGIICDVLTIGSIIIAIFRHDVKK